MIHVLRSEDGHTEVHVSIENGSFGVIAKTNSPDHQLHVTTYRNYNLTSASLYGTVVEERKGPFDVV